MRASTMILALGAVGLAACGPDITLSDNVDLTWDFSVTPSRFDDALHTPYVRGAHVTLSVDSSDDHESFAGWTLVSADDRVFRFDSATARAAAGRLSVDGDAVGEGTAEVTVLDRNGHEVGRAPIEVALPDRVELDAHAYLILGQDDRAKVVDPRIVENGSATFLVRYFLGATELHGNGVLSTAASDSVQAEARTSFLFEQREWLTLHAGSAGKSALELFADGAASATVNVTTVPETDIAKVELLGEPEAGHDDGEWLVVLAQAYDGSARRIFGVDYQWDVDGAQATGEGDLYRYELKQGTSHMLTANRAGQSASLMIASDQGYVDSSNQIGCSMGAAGTGPIAAPAVLALLAVRRRRPRSGTR